MYACVKMYEFMNVCMYLCMFDFECMYMYT